MGQDIGNLVRGHCIQPAAKGIELNQIQIILGLYKAGSSVKAGVVHPLVRHHQRPFHPAQMGYGILGEDGKSIRGNQLRYTVVNLRVHMIGPAGQDYAPLSVFLQPGQSLLAFFHQIIAGGSQLLPGGMGSHPDFGSRNLECPGKFLYKGIGENLLVGKCHKGIHKTHVFLGQRLHVIFNVFRIGGDHGAVVVVACVRAFIALIGDAGVEDELYALLNEPGHMSVYQLGRITLGFAGDGFDSQLIELPGGLGRQHHMVAQLLKEHSPEGEVFIHVEHPGNAYRTAVRLVHGQGFVVKHPVVLVIKQVGNLFLGLFKAKTPLAAVA